MGRSPSAAKNGLKKGPWDPEEDKKLVDFIEKHGPGNWISLAKLAGLNRCGKSCRLRWINYLRPDIKRGGFTSEEEQTILRLHSILGNKWSAIAMQLPGRTDNEVKNFWNTHLKKRLIRMGCDPMTHEPRTDLLMTTCLRLLAMANLKSLLNYSPLDVNAVYKLPHLKHLLQSTDAGAPNLVNSIPSLLLLLKENPILNSLSQLENQASFSNEPTIPQPLHHPITTSPLITSPTLQVDPQVLLPPSFQTALFDDEFGHSGGFLQWDNLTDSISQWDFQSDSGTVPSFMTETTAPISNLGDVSSSSSLYGDRSESSSPWTEIFFDDPTAQ